MYSLVIPTYKDLYVPFKSSKGTLQRSKYSIFLFSVKILRFIIFKLRNIICAYTYHNPCAPALSVQCVPFYLGTFWVQIYESRSVVLNPGCTVESPGALSIPHAWAHSYPSPLTPLRVGPCVADCNAQPGYRGHIGSKLFHNL